MYEYLPVLRNCASNGMLASLDVESLFTNVPLQDPIDIICNKFYNHSSIHPPTITPILVGLPLYFMAILTDAKSVP